MEKTRVKIITKANGKRVAYYRSPKALSWFSMSVADATKALRDGKAHIGLNVVPVEAA